MMIWRCCHLKSWRHRWHRLKDASTPRSQPTALTTSLPAEKNESLLMLSRTVTKMSSTVRHAAVDNELAKLLHTRLVCRRTWLRHEHVKHQNWIFLCKPFSGQYRNTMIGTLDRDSIFGTAKTGGWTPPSSRTSLPTSYHII